MALSLLTSLIFLEYGQGVADVIEEPDAKADVKFRFGFVIQKICLQKRTLLGQTLALARLLTKTNHHFRNVDAHDFGCTPAREFQGIEGVSATNIQESATLDRFAVLNSKRKTLVHILAEELVERIGKPRFTMRVNPLECVSFAIPKFSLGLNLVVQIWRTSLIVVNSKSLTRRVNRVSV